MNIENIRTRKLFNHSVIVRYVALPESIRGYTIKDMDDNFNVYINSKMTYEIQKETLEHEMTHVELDDFNCEIGVKYLED